MLRNIFTGELNRTQFLIRYLISIILGISVVVILVLISKSSASYQGSAFMLMLIVFSVLVYIYQLSLYVRRLRNIGISVFFVFLSLIPLINFLLLLYLLFAPGKTELAQQGRT